MAPTDSRTLAREKKGPGKRLSKKAKKNSLPSPENAASPGGRKCGSNGVLNGVLFLVCLVIEAFHMYRNHLIVECFSEVLFVTFPGLTGK